MIERDALLVLLDARVAGITPRDELHACIRHLMSCGWTQRRISERLGLSKYTVRHWCDGRAVPRDYAVLIPLARMARSASLPVRRIYGMQRVVVALCDALKISRSELGRRIGRNRQACAPWMNYRYGPNRVSTLRLLKLVRVNRLDPAFERICEIRLEELWRADQERKQWVERNAILRRERAAKRIPRFSVIAPEMPLRPASPRDLSSRPCDTEPT